VSLVGPGGLLAQITKTVLQTALDTEMAEHLGYLNGDASGRGRVITATAVRRRRSILRSARRLSAFDVASDAECPPDATNTRPSYTLQLGCPRPGRCGVGR